MSSSIPDNLKASVDDFKIAVPDCELVSLTNLDDPEATIIDETKLQFALDEAFSLICAFDVKACPAGKVAIRRRTRRAMLVIARYEIDVLHRRPDVEKEYERMLEFLKDCTDKELCNCDPDPQDLLDVGLAENSQVGFTSCFDERRHTIPETANGLNLPYFDNHDPRFLDRNGVFRNDN